MKRAARLWLLCVLVLTAACSVQIFDLQPIIIGTNTPLPTEPRREVYVGVTPSPVVREATLTPPVHIAPTAITSQVGVNIFELTMVDGGTGWAVGRILGSTDKLILRSVDGAVHWKNVTPSQAAYDNAGKVSDVTACFRDANHAWVIFQDPEDPIGDKGITIWRTDDGGQIWDAVSLPRTGYSMQIFEDPQINFLDSLTGWIFARIGRNENREFIGVYTTYDGGRNWNPMVTTNSGNQVSGGKKNGTVFRDTLEGWLTGENTPAEPDAVLWRTFDGGNSWIKQPVPVPNMAGIPAGLLSDPAYSCSFSVPKFVDMQREYAWSVLSCSGGSLGEPVSILYWTFDRLLSWRTFLLPRGKGTLTFYGIDNGWYAVGNPPGSDFPYEVLSTVDRGENWRTASKLAWDSKLQFITPSIGFGIAMYMGMPALVKTSDGGTTWEQIFAMVVP